MLDYVIPAFVTLFVIIDPIGLVPIFIALTRDGSASYKKRMALQGVLIAFGILLLFALVGKPLLAALGISLAAFRISGGALLFLIALEMVFERRNKKRSDRAEERHDELAAQHEQDRQLQQTPEDEPDDVAAFPLAMPFLAGPGAIATIMLLMSQHHGDWIAQAAIIAAMASVLLIAAILFIISGVAARFLAPSVTNVVSRLLGMLLAALSIQFVIDGFKQAFDLQPI